VRHPPLWQAQGGGRAVLRGSFVEFATARQQLQRVGLFFRARAELRKSFFFLRRALIGAA